MKSIRILIILMMWFTILITCGLNAIVNAQETENKTLNVFCTAPAVYGKGRTENEVIEKLYLKIISFQHCYVRNITSIEPKEFKIRLRLIIKPSGRVENATILYEGTKNKDFLGCIKNIFMQIKFTEILLIHGDCIVDQSIIFRIL